MLHRDVAPGIHRVEDAYVNWYVIEAGDGLTIVDAGHPASWRSLLATLEELDRAPGSIAGIVLTHGHFDHVGFAERARTELGIPVFVPRGEVQLVEHPWRYEHERRRLPYALRHPRFAWVFASMTVAGAPLAHGVRQVTTYEDGDVLDLPGSPRVVSTPGHTHAHCALHMPDRDVVFSGDALVTFDPYTGGHGPQVVAGAATADSALALRSLDLLEATGATIVLPGHGEPWRDGIAAAVAAARVAGAH